MNRLAVYSYLTRYPYGHTGSGRLFTVPLAEKSRIPGSIHVSEPDELRTNPPDSSYRGPPFQDLTPALNEPSQIMTLALTRKTKKDNQNQTIVSELTAISVPSKVLL